MLNNSNKTKSKLPVVIFVGGHGSRMKEETVKIPKPMVDVGGYPLVWHIMKMYSHYGFNHFILTLGYKGDYIRNYVKKHPELFDEFEIELIETGEATKTGGRLLRVADYIQEDTFLCTYGDGVSDVDIGEILKFHNNLDGVVGTIAGVNMRHRFGIINISEEGKLIRYEKHHLMEKPVNMGFMVLTKDFLKYLREDMMVEAPFNTLAGKQQLGVYYHKDGYFHAVDTYRELEVMNETWRADPPWKVWSDEGDEKVERGLPTISIVIPVLNSEKTLDRCLKSIKSQDYPQENIETLIIDGGSTDRTKEISEKYNCKFVEKGYKDGHEARKGVGLHASTGELVCYIDSDNILPNKAWLSQMAKPLVDNANTVASQTWRFGMKEDFSLLNRYCALLGANDPVVFYLGKSEKISWQGNSLQMNNIIDDNEAYVAVRFNEQTLPTVGGNGFLIRREILLKSNCEPEDFFHIDVVLDIVRQGYDEFALVKNEIYRNSPDTLTNLAYKRINYFTVHNPSHLFRRYLIFDTTRVWDLINLSLFMFFTVTIIQPLLFSLRGFVKKRDIAWFLHPIVCWVFLLSYAYGSLQSNIKKKP
jgi:glucose-1-phosphate cytidylyltransferase